MSVRAVESSRIRDHLWTDLTKQMRVETSPAMAVTAHRRAIGPRSAKSSGPIGESRPITTNGVANPRTRCTPENGPSRAPTAGRHPEVRDRALATQAVSAQDRRECAAGGAFRGGLMGGEPDTGVEVRTQTDTEHVGG